MYVIQAGGTDTDGTLYPADRCTFVTTYVESKGGYQIDIIANKSPIFYDGVSSSHTTIPSSASNRARLGYIGKNGRFVAMTVD